MTVLNLVLALVLVLVGMSVSDGANFFPCTSAQWHVRDVNVVKRTSLLGGKVELEAFLLLGLGQRQNDLVPLGLWQRRIIRIYSMELPGENPPTPRCQFNDLAL